MDYGSIVQAVISFLVGTGLAGVIGKYALKKAGKILADVSDGKISAEEGRAYAKDMGKIGKSIMKKLRKASFIKMLILLAMAPIAIFLLCGCAAYNKHVAPKIPAVHLEGSVGGEGIGASVGFTSKWTDGERKRQIEVQPELGE